MKEKKKGKWTKDKRKRKKRKGKKKKKGKKILREIFYRLGRRLSLSLFSSSDLVSPVFSLVLPYL